MFWIPYIRRQGPRFIAGCSPDPAYDLGFFGAETELWTLTYPLATAYAWAVVRYLEQRPLGTRWAKWRLTHGVRRLLRELGLPARTRLGRVRADEFALSFAPPEIETGPLAGRVLTPRELAEALFGHGSPRPPGFERGLQQAILAGQIQVRPGILVAAGWRPVCTRCGSSRITTAPCTHCGAADCLICEDCAMLGPIRGCTPLLTAPVQNTPIVAAAPGLQTPLQLTAGQAELVGELLKLIPPGGEDCLVDSVCGSGKGYMLLELLRRLLLAHTGQRILVSTPRRSVIDEWSARFAEVLGEENLSVLGAGRHLFRPHAPVTLATLPQLYRFDSLFDLAIIDEADAFPLGRDWTYWGLIKRVLTANSRLVLFTATPQALPEFCRRFRRLSLPVRFHGRPLPEPVIEVAGTKEQSLALTARLIRHWREDAARRVYIFVPTKRIGQEVFAYLTKKGYRGKSCNLLFAGLTDFQQKLDQFRSGDVPIAIATTVLERGLTVSPCAVLVFWADHPNFQAASLVQMAGRCGRSLESPGGEVVFLCRNANAAAPAEALRQIRQANAEAEKKGFLQ